MKIYMVSLLHRATIIKNVFSLRLKIGREQESTVLQTRVNSLGTLKPARMPQCTLHMGCNRMCYEEHGTKFDVYSTKQHKSSTKFAVLQTSENSFRTLRPARMPRCIHGIIMSDSANSAVRGVAQNLAYAAKIAQKQHKIHGASDV